MPRRKSMMRVSLEDGEVVREDAIAAAVTAGFSVDWQDRDLTILKHGAKELRVASSVVNLRCTITDAYLMFTGKESDPFAMALAWANAVDEARATDDDFAKLPKAAFARLYHRFTVNLAVQAGDSDATGCADGAGATV